MKTIRVDNYSVISLNNYKYYLYNDTLYKTSNDTVVYKFMKIKDTTETYKVVDSSAIKIGEQAKIGGMIFVLLAFFICVTIICSTIITKLKLKKIRKHYENRI